MTILESVADKKIQETRFFTTLDGLRGLAALCIAIRHAPYLWGSNHHPVNFFRESYLAVDFFFVLSGFILAFAYQGRLSNNMKLQEFIFVRALRLYPLYLLSIILLLPYIVWSAATGKTSYSDLFLSITTMIFMLPNPLASISLFPYNPVVWSLFFENIANVIFGAFTRLMQPRFLIAYLVPCGLFLALSVHQGWLGFGTGNGPMDAGPTWQSFGAGLVRVMYSFFAGVFVYHLHERKFMRVIINPLFICLPLLLVLLSYPSVEFADSFDVICTVLVFPLIVMVGSYNNPTGSLSKLFEIAGGLSYGIYVLQIPIYILCNMVFYKLIGDNIYLNPVFFGLLSVSIMSMISAVSFYGYDHPLRKWIGKRHKTRSRSHSGILKPNVGSG